MTDETIFATALEKADLAQRAAFLAEACGDDTERRQRLEGLLLAHARAANFLERPPVAAPDPDKGATQALSGAPGPRVAAAQTTDDETGSSHDEPLTFLAPPTRPDALGRLGHYEVLQVLGRGGFGIVFRAFDEMLQRVVALKVMAPQLAATSPARKRFLREARSSAQVRHENVVQVYEVAEQPLPYLAMEFIPGETLQQKLDRVGPLDVPETLRIGRQIAEGLAAAHATDLIHRDIKPGNVLLEGGQHKAKITDFGLARAADDASISQSGIIAGTPMYMAPEQAEGQTLDQRADLFSLGSVLYQMVAGRPPFRANTTVAVLKRVAEDKPRAIREIIPETPQWLCDIIAKLHAKNPDDRYQSARELADVLADCEAQLKANARLKDYSRIPRSEPPRSGRRRWVAAAVAVLLPVIALVVTEFAGVTHLFRGQVATNDETEGWVQLFNGKDLSGWKKDPKFPGSWRVDEDGHLVGAGRVDFAFLGTVRDDFENFHLRVEAMVDTPESDSGVFFRVPVLKRGSGFAEINIAGDAVRRGEQTGSLLVEKDGWKKAGGGTWYPAARGLTKPKEWFILEIIARGDHVVTKVNGKLALDTEAPTANRRGHIFLQQCGGKTIVRFRKIEIKELPANTKSEALSPTDFTNTLGMKFKLIPAGRFTMGSPKEEIDRCLKQLAGAWLWQNLATEGPEHLVEITKPFYLGVTEVTVGQFRQFVDEEAYQVGDGRWTNPGFDQTDQHPVVWVSWNNAVDFCKWLSKKEGKEYRLPTEAEWEYCCRAGRAGGRYCFGDDDAQLENYTWFKQNSRGGTHPVGKKKPNACGLYDMHGNASESCQDNYDPDYYKSSPVKDPPGPSAGGARAGRGGSWKFGPVICRSAMRGYSGPDQRWDFCGFRVLLVSAATGAGTESGAKNKPSSPAIAPFTDADVQRIAALPAAEQVEEVRKELMRRNPGFDGKMGHKIEGGVVTEIRIVTDQVTDIAPIRVFNSLQVLDLGGTHTNYHPNGQLADLSPLKGMNLTELTKLNLSLTKVGDAGLVHFKDCTHLTHLGLGDTQVSDSGLAYFKNCKSLTSLELFFIPASDVGLAYFKDCKDLTDLNLACTQLSDVGLAYFKDCNLRSLDVNRTRVSDAGLAPFEGCKELTLLHLRSTQVSDAGLAHFKDCKQLTRLYIRLTKISDLSLLKGMPLKVLDCDFRPERDAEILRSIKTLERINGKPAAEFWQRYDKGEFGKPAAPFTDADVQRIAALPAALQVEEVRKELIRRNPRFDGQVVHKIENGVVTRFKIVTDQVTDIAPIRVFSALRWLACPGTDTNFRPNGQLEDLTPLEGMNLAALTHLWLSNTRVGDAGPATFKDCKNLLELDLWNTKLTDAGLAHFKDCKSLTHLNLGATRVSDAGLVHFHDCKALTHLNLAWTTVTDAGLAHFKGCENLTNLWLPDTQVGDAGLAHFQDCKALTSLNLAGTKLSDVGLAHFKDCKNLKYLYVDRTQVGDTGLANVKGMRLMELNIDDTAITDLTPLQGMPLEHVRLTPKNITRGLDILRDMKSLKTIGIRWRTAWPAAEFWERYDKGEFTK